MEVSSRPGFPKNQFFTLVLLPFVKCLPCIVGDPVSFTVSNISVISDEMLVSVDTQAQLHTFVCRSLWSEASDGGKSRDDVWPRSWHGVQPQLHSVCRTARSHWHRHAGMQSSAKLQSPPLLLFLLCSCD